MQDENWNGMFPDLKIRAVADAIIVEKVFNSNTVISESSRVWFCLSTRRISSEIHFLAH